MAKAQWTRGSNQHKTGPNSAAVGRSSDAEVSLVATNPYMTLGPEIVESRGLLLHVLDLLNDQSEALTVLGAHAVFDYLDVRVMPMLFLNSWSGPVLR